MASHPSETQKTTRRILGLDLGTTSIGWCLLEGDPAPKRIIASGVRIFPEGMDRTRGEQSLNQDRREARSLRRQTYRRARRKQKLLHALQEIGLLPTDPVELLGLMRDTDPYALRSRALDQQLEAWHVGRALYHLGQRRGYLSNRKTGNDKDDGKVAEGIGELAQAIQQTGSRTLGEYFHQLDPQQTRIRSRYTSRQMFKEEFELIWQKQAEYYPVQMDVANRKRIYDAIFDQRPLKLQKNLIGACEFEPGRKRAPRASLVAQEFRLWQSLNSLNVLFSDGEERFLNDQERETLYQQLAIRKDMGWEAIRKALDFPASARFNLEKMRKSGLQGNQTAAAISSATGKKTWNALGEKMQEQLVYDLLNIESESALRTRLGKHYRFADDAIEKLLKKSLTLSRGYLHISSKAARNISHALKRMQNPDERGLTYNLACEAAGYVHTQPLAPGERDQLPFPGQIAKDKPRRGKHYQHDPLNTESTVTTAGLRNPLVERALYQLRRVVNAIVKQYGMPDIIRVEMARDLKSSRKQREDDKKRQRQNEEANQRAEQALLEFGLPNPKRSDKLKYRLWEECGHTCPYTGKAINMNSLFGDHPQFDIEHIIPYSRCLDDSYMNKTLCDKAENDAKGNLTPWEFYHGNEKNYAQVLQRAKKLPYPKFKRFAKDAIKELPEFVSQQLNDTRYISRQAVAYLQQLEGVTVEPVKGGTTALLRRAWGLNHILSDSGEKTRLDHRHHAVDALVCALTDRAAVQKLNRYAALSNGRLKIVDYPSPIPGLRELAQTSIGDIIISHKALRKVKGPLHEETLYRFTNEKDAKGNPLIVLRKPLATLKAKDLDAICDNRIRQLAKTHLANCDGNLKKAFAQLPTTFGFHGTKKDTERFVPINKVRVQYPLKVRAIGQGKRQRHVKTGSNHHIAIYEKNSNGKVKWIGQVISTLDAVLRMRQGLPLIEKQHPDAEFIMALHINDAVEMQHNGESDIFVLQKVAQSGQFYFRQHQDASEKKDMTLAVSKSAETLRKSKARKVSISLLGRVMPADD